MRSPTPSADELVLTLWTDDPELARRADAAGVDRIGIDLERLGKRERQGGRGTWISGHRLESLDRVAGSLERAQPFARIDPPHDGTAAQVDEVIAHGARVVMLPMVAGPDEAEAFAAAVDGRARVVLLVERPEAVRRIAELAAVDGVEEIHLGLNDLALSLGMSTRWQVLAGDLASDVGAAVRERGRAFGLGGIGPPGMDDLPVPSDLVYAELARTGATATLLSRSFMRRAEGDLATCVRAARDALADWRRRPAAALEDAHTELARRAAAVVEW
jgi:hypothetical protein